MFSATTFDADFHRGAADVVHRRQKRHQLADVDRLFEGDLIHRQRHHILAGVAAGTGIATWSSSFGMAPPCTLPEKLAMSGVISTVIDESGSGLARTSGQSPRDGGFMFSRANKLSARQSAPCRQTRPATGARPVAARRPARRWRGNDQLLFSPAALADSRPSSISHISQPMPPANTPAKPSVSHSPGSAPGGGRAQPQPGQRQQRRQAVEHLPEGQRQHIHRMGGTQLFWR